MNTERLHIITLAIRNDLAETKVQATLEQLVSALQNQVNQPQQPDFQQQVSKQLITLNEALSKASSNSFSPGWRQSIKELAIDYLLGNELAEALQEVFRRNQITPSVALDEIKELSNEVTALKKAVDEIAEGFDYLEIGKEELEPGECEIGVLIPRSAVNNKLNNLGKELSDLDGVFRTFSEVATGKRPDFEIRSISSSDLTVYLSMLPPIAACLAFATEKIINIYRQLLEIKKLRKEMRDQGVPLKNLIGISKHANSIMRTGIDELAKEILEQYYKKDDKERYNELSTDLRFALNKIAKRIDKGYNIEIRIEPLSESDDGTINPKTILAKKHLGTIRSAYKALEFIKTEGDSILSLPESQISRTKKKDKGTKTKG